MDRANAMVFPSIGMHALTAIIHSLGATILAYFISRRTLLRADLTLRDVSWSWICVLLIFIDSWLFIFASGILTLGVGLEENDASCSAGIFLFIVFYGTSKLFIYAFLSERAYIVWRSTPESRRLQCKVYLGCVAVLFGYCGVIGTLFYGSVSFFGGDSGACYIGLKEPVSITLLAYDFFTNAFLTGLFLWPVVCGSYQEDHVKHFAMRTSWSALMGLATSCVNILVLTLMHGRRLGWVCLVSCGADVIVNALVVYWVTLQPSDQEDGTSDDILLSKPEGPRSGRKDSLVRASKVVFRLERSKQDFPNGHARMEIKVPTERIDERSESPTDESEYEVRKAPLPLQVSPDEGREEISSPGPQK